MTGLQLKEGIVPCSHTEYLKWCSEQTWTQFTCAPSITASQLYWILWPKTQFKLSKRNLLDLQVLAFTTWSIYTPPKCPRDLNSASWQQPELCVVLNYKEKVRMQLECSVTWRESFVGCHCEEFVTPELLNCHIHFPCENG